MKRYWIIKRFMPVALLISILSAMFLCCTDSKTDDNLPTTSSISTYGVKPPVIANISTAAFPTDEWEHDSSSNHNINAKVFLGLEEMMAEHFSSGISEGGNVILARDGYLVYENNEGWHKTQFQKELMSLTSTFVSALIGIAIDEGYINGTDDKILDYFRDWDIDNVDADIEAMTIKDILVMSSDMKLHEKSPVIQELKGSENPVLSLLTTPIEEHSSIVWKNSPALQSILTAIIQHATGMTALEYANKKLFEPLGMKDVIWVADKQGINFGGFGLQLYPSDLLKFGYLFLQNGEWDGKQIISKEWINESVSSGYHWQSVEGVEAGEYLLDSEGFSINLKESVNSGEVYRAVGDGGQYIYVYPKYNIITVIINTFYDLYADEEHTGKYGGDYGNNLFLVDILGSIVDAVEYTESSRSETANHFVMPEMTGELVVYRVNLLNDTLIDAAVKIYKKEYPNVEVKVVEFNDYDDYIDIFKTEVAAGKGPDVWVGNNYDFDDIYKTANTGVFENLTEYMENDGTDWSLYNKSVLDSGIYKGKQYFLPISYQVPILMTTGEIMREEEIDFQQIKSFSDLMSAIGKIQQKYTLQEKCLFRGVRDSQNMDFFIDKYYPWSGMQFINYETGDIIQDSSDLRDMVDAMKWGYLKVAEMSTYSSSFEQAEDLVNKDRIFANINAIEYICNNYGLLSNHSEPLYMLYPDIDGKSTASVNLLGAVLKNSKSKVNAYSFLKVLLSERIQINDTLWQMNTPVLKSAVKSRFDKILKLQSKTPRPLLDENGEKGLYIAPLEETKASEFADMLINIDRCVIEASTPISFFYRDFRPYFENNKTYEQCFAVFRNNLELLYSE